MKKRHLGSTHFIEGSLLKEIILNIECAGLPSGLSRVLHLLCFLHIRRWSVDFLLILRVHRLQLSVATATRALLGPCAELRAHLCN